MKVLIVAMALDIGGAETHVYHLAKGLKKKGIESIVLSAGGVYVPMLEDNHIRHVQAPLDKKDPKSLMTSIKCIRQLVKTEKIDLIHAHGRIPALVSKIIAKIHQVPFLVTAHAKFRANFIYRLTSFWGDCTISISEDIKQHLINRFKVPVANIQIIENGIDTALFHREIHKKEEGSKRIVFMSRLDEPLGKMCKKVIEAIEALDQQGYGMTLDIIGDGDYFNPLRACIENIELKHSEIHLLGKRTDVQTLLPKHELAICVSRSAMEAMACQLPLILAGGEGYMGILSEQNIKEAMLNNLTGRGYKKNVSVEKLQEDIKKILFEIEESQREAMGEFNRQMILKRYSLERMVQKTIEVYKGLLGAE